MEEAPVTSGGFQRGSVTKVKETKREILTRMVGSHFFSSRSRFFSSPSRFFTLIEDLSENHA